jgi:hypothetical protein
MPARGLERYGRGGDGFPERTRSPVEVERTRRLSDELRCHGESLQADRFLAQTIHQIQQKGSTARDFRAPNRQRWPARRTRLPLGELNDPFKRDRQMSPSFPA